MGAGPWVARDARSAGEAGDPAMDWWVAAMV